MSESIEHYIAAIREHLSRRLSTLEVADHAAEIEQHLRSAAAELPAGESDAIAAFGDAKVIARQIIEAYSNPRRRFAVSAVAIAVAIPLAFVLTPLYLIKSQGNVNVFLSVIATFLLLFLICSFKARTLVSKSLAVAALATIFLLPLLECTLYVTIFPESAHGLVPRFQIKQEVAEAKTELAELASIRAEFRIADSAYRNGSKSDIAKLHNTRGYIVPTKLVRSYPSQNGSFYSVQRLTVTNLDEAKEIWLGPSSPNWQIQLYESFEQGAATLGAQQDLPLWNEYIPFFRDNLVPTGLYFLIMLMMNFGCVKIKCWSARRRQVST